MMKIDYKKQVLYLHQSDLNTLRMCPEQKRLDARGELFGNEGGTGEIGLGTGDSAAIGTLVHKFIEACLNTYRTEMVWPTPEAAFVVVRNLQQELADKWGKVWRHPHQIEDLAQAQQYVEQACLNWWANVRPSMEGDPSGWAIELEFDEELGILPISREGAGFGGTEDWSVNLRGSIDFFDAAKGQVRDWKSSKPAFNLWKLERYDVQSNVYAWAIQKTYGVIPTFHYQHMARGSDKHVEVPLTPTSETIAMMSEEMMSWAHTILSLGLDQPWPKGPTDWWCSSRWCSHHARGLCAGEHNQIFADEAHYLTDLIPSDYLSNRQQTTKESL